MKLKDILKEAESASPYSTFHGRAPALFSAYNVGYRASPGNNFDDKMGKSIESDKEEHLIDRAIDILHDKYPELIKDKKVKRHMINMLIGKITSGANMGEIDIEKLIKKLWKDKKVKVT
tara:strand:+ start:2255 stop:2611 length:357 start_codon:yes stop_codon:yes gene_type:complete